MRNRQSGCKPCFMGEVEETIVCVCLFYHNSYNSYTSKTCNGQKLPANFGEIS